MNRSWSALLVAVAAVALGACGAGAPSPMSTFSVEPQGTPSPVEVPAVPTETAAPPVPAAPPAPGAAPVPEGPGGRSVPPGQVFQLRLGEMVRISGADLVVTYLQFLSDTRCSPGVRCVVAGNARISVTVASDTHPPATFVLNTDQTPRSARYQDRTVEFVGLTRGNQPTASFRVD